jgi:branched-chain amino acid transport system substrate-binding protein
MRAGRSKQRYLRRKIMQRVLATGLFFALLASPALAEITVGISVCATGPAASLGIPEKNTFALLPTTVAGEKIRYIVLDDATDTTLAVKNARKFTAEDKVDIILGSSSTPTSLAIVEVANEGRTPMIAMAPIVPAADKLAWVFSVPQSNALMASAIIEHMQEAGVKTMAFIGYNDAFGEGYWSAVAPLAAKAKIAVVANERYNRTDSSVTGQALKILAANPDAVLIVGSGTPAALPEVTLAERGYKGKVYQSHGAANRDFLRVGGKNVEGAILPVGPVLVPEQLADSHPVKKVALEYVRAYEAVYGADSRSTFGGHAWDAGALFLRAAGEALKKAKPGSQEFRDALRAALEATRDLPGSHGVFTMSATDHTGLDARSRVLVHVENGTWRLIKQ